MTDNESPDAVTIAGYTDMQQKEIERLTRELEDTRSRFNELALRQRLAVKSEIEARERAKKAEAIVWKLRVVLEDATGEN